MPAVLPLLHLLACAHTPEWPDDPAEASLVTEDLPRFWAAVDAPGDLEHNLDARYLEPGTPGLDAMRKARFRDAEGLADAYRADRAWYEAVRKNTLALDDDPTTMDAVRAALVAAETDWPAAVHPPVTFVVAHFGTGGTVTPEGVVIGVEMFTAPTEGAPVETLDAWHRAVVRSADALPHIVSHEHAHAQQEQLCGWSRATLLEQALVEGGADWLAERWSGGHVGEEAYDWALPREAEVWARFRRDMDDHALSDWMYEGVREDGQPADVGYFVGYRIVQAWWAAHGEEPGAMDEVIGAPCDAEAFLAESGYDPR